MDTHDWRTFAKVPGGFSRVHEVWRLAGEFQFICDGPPDGQILVKVWEDYAGKFWGHSNWMIQAPGTASPYMSLHSYETVDEALYDSISGLYTFYPSEPEKQAQTQWLPNENY